MANILCVKLVFYVEEIEEGYQRGFRKGRSTVDQILTTIKHLKIVGNKM
jgi:hypothetical protein